MRSTSTAINCIVLVMCCALLGLLFFTFAILRLISMLLKLFVFLGFIIIILFKKIL